MHPILFHLGGLGVGTHEFFLLLGVAVGLAWFARDLRRSGRSDDARWWQIAAGALLGGAILAKASTAWRYIADNPHPSFGGLWTYGGKSLLGGLAGAYIGVLITKRIIGFREKTGDLLTPAVILAIAVGRIGCFLTEPPGTPTSLPWGVRLSTETVARIPGCERCVAGVPLHPTFLYEIAFLLAMFALLRWIRPRIPVPGETFKLFLLGYGLFRFGIEFIRVNPKFVLDLSGSQVFLLVTMPILIGYFVRQLVRGAYRTEPVVAILPVPTAEGRPRARAAGA